MPQLRPRFIPRRGLTPFQDPGVGFAEGVQPFPVPKEELARDYRCEPKRKRKPRKPRTVCYRGTYRETSSSTTKRRLEEVPCESAKRQVKGAVVNILGGGDPLGELQTRARTVAGQLGRKAYVGAVEALRRKAREQLGEKWVPLTPAEKRKRRAAEKAAELKRLRRELREAKRKRS